MEKRDRLKITKKMKTSDENDLSDHQAEILTVIESKNRWRTEAGHEERVPRGKFEASQNEEKKRDYEKTREKMKVNSRRSGRMRWEK